MGAVVLFAMKVTVCDPVFANPFACAYRQPAWNAVAALTRFVGQLYVLLQATSVPHANPFVLA